MQHEPIRVAVAGALGRMGRVACAALRSSPSLIYAGGLARTRDAAEQIVDSFDELIATSKPHVLLDLTRQPDSATISMAALRAGVRPVIGATGWSDVDRNALGELAAQLQIGAMLVPNFSMGAALMMRFAEQAARYFPTAEIIELHHDEKLDKPSGTATLTAERMAVHRPGKVVPIHSVRLRGLIAHQEVLFGNTGELLTIRHDSLSRESFVPGMLAAITAVMHSTQLTIGLDRVFDEQE